jgi:hypothetical protein
MIFCSQRAKFRSNIRFVIPEAAVPEHGNITRIRCAAPPPDLFEKHSEMPVGLEVLLSPHRCRTGASFVAEE